LCGGSAEHLLHPVGIDFDLEVSAFELGLYRASFVLPVSLKQ